MPAYEAESNMGYFELDGGPSPEQLQMPLAVVPPFVHKIGAIAAERGFAEAVVEVFADANITIEHDTALTTEGNRGLIVAGDHSRTFEPLLAQAAVGNAGHNASHVVAMPISLPGRFMQATEAGKGLIIPVIPTSWAAENEFSWRSDPRNSLRRALHPDVLRQPKADLRRINAAATISAAEVASGGSAVTIFPTGGAISPDTPWRKGLGQIVNQVAPEAADTTEVAVFGTEPFSPKRLLSSLLLRDMGIRPKPQTIVMSTHRVGTVAEVREAAASMPELGLDQAATDVVREHYMQMFGKKA